MDGEAISCTWLSQWNNLANLLKKKKRPKFPDVAERTGWEVGLGDSDSPSGYNYTDTHRKRILQVCHGKT
jgi:hypothetical protein